MMDARLQQRPSLLKRTGSPVDEEALIDLHGLMRVIQRRRSLILAISAVMAIAAIGWPVVRLARYRYGYKSDLTGRPLLLHRLTRVTAWLFILLVVGWFGIMMLLESDLSALDDGLDIWIRLLQLVLVGAIVGTAVVIWNAWTVTTAPGRHRFATVWSILIAVSAAFLVWLCLNVGMLTTSLNY